MEYFTVSSFGKRILTGILKLRQRCEGRWEDPLGAAYGSELAHALPISLAGRFKTVKSLGSVRTECRGRCTMRIPCPGNRQAKSDHRPRGFPNISGSPLREEPRIDYRNNLVRIRRGGGAFVRQGNSVRPLGVLSARRSEGRRSVADRRGEE